MSIGQPVASEVIFAPTSPTTTPVSAPNTVRTIVSIRNCRRMSFRHQPTSQSIIVQVSLRLIAILPVLVALPFCNIRLRDQKPLPHAYPAESKTLGDHLRKKRLDLGLFQKDVARILGVAHPQFLLS